ncbi:MAG: alpha/beta hydrolase [Anaerolineae bacterium]|nr:alpha/beta hydrolase [Anaerolineae bacterium]
MPFVTVNDKPIYYESTGTGKPLVFIHALLMNGRMWSDQVAYFSDQYQVITLDLYGYGKSKLTESRIMDFPEDIKGFLDALNIEKAHIVGLSMGSMQAQSFALTYPNRVDKLALISTGSAGFDYPDEAEAWWTEFITAVKARDFTTAKHIFTRTFVDGHRNPARDEVKSRTQAMMDDYDFVHLLDDTLLWKEYDITLAAYKAYTAPVLVVAGDDEPPVHKVVEASQFLATQFPNAKCEVIANASHFVNLDQPETFNRVLKAFLG